MNKVIRYFKEHRNKILAVSFSALALAVFLGYYGVLEILTGGFYFRHQATTGDLIIEMWNFVFYAVLVYGGLMYRNIQNDGRAYSNILIFIFSLAFNLLLDLLEEGIYTVFDVASGQTISVVFFLLSVLFTIGQMVIGILLYINIARYMRGYSVPWKRIRTLAIVFAILVGLGAFPLVALSMLLLGDGLIALLSVPVSEAFCSIAIIFTLERLRRY